MKIKNYEPSVIEIYNKDREIVLREKTLIAFSQPDMKIKAIGTDAEAFQNMDDVLLYSPLRHGMIADSGSVQRGKGIADSYEPQSCTGSRGGE